MTSAAQCADFLTRQSLLPRGSSVGFAADSTVHRCPRASPTVSPNRKDANRTNREREKRTDRNEEKKGGKEEKRKKKEKERRRKSGAGKERKRSVLKSTEKRVSESVTQCCVEDTRGHAARV
eukprot:1627980-Rhodomonas_salina.2